MSTRDTMDMLRYREILQSDSQEARNSFSQIPNGTTLFYITPTIRCDRTFSRGSQEAYYLDDMDKYLQSPPCELRVEDITLLLRSLEETSLSSFNRRGDYFKEHLERRRLMRWIPYCSIRWRILSSYSKRAHHVCAL